MPKNKDARIIKMLEMQDRGMLKTQIAKHFGISKQRVGQLIGVWKYDTSQICSSCGEPFIPKQANATICNKHCLVSYKQRCIDRLASRLHPPNERSCWEWSGYINPTTGYGNTTWRGSYMSPHRVMWCILYGDIPSTTCILHVCDNPLCCNPYHLYSGTPADNVRDREHRHRGNRSHKFTQQQIDHIRATCRSNNDIPAFAAHYSVHPYTIYNVIRRKTYAG